MCKKHKTSPIILRVSSFPLRGVENANTNGNGQRFFVSGEFPSGGSRKERVDLFYLLMMISKMFANSEYLMYTSLPPSKPHSGLV